MSAGVLTTNHDAHHDHHAAAEADRNVFGFWIYIMSDCILFASIFAVYAVLYKNTFGGIGPSDVASLPFVFIETMLLLTSSFTYGIAMLVRRRGLKNQMFMWMGLTILLGACFLGMELYEFSHLIHEGEAWRNSAFLSAFFTLVGTHGLHVFVGLIWMIIVMIQVQKHGINTKTTTKLSCLGLFWHFLDVVWIFVFSIVYLMGAIT
ncbi:cytochrome o ubiquinol oxidase subunit III [Francisellaceae bacterium]|nr:cytochrome o ubiquinol oxidase subunit III [Francisellaceae bacterium]